VIMIHDCSRTFWGSAIPATSYSRCSALIVSSTHPRQHISLSWNSVFRIQSYRLHANFEWSAFLSRFKAPVVVKPSYSDLWDANVQNFSEYLGAMSRLIAWWQWGIELWTVEQDMYAKVHATNESGDVQDLGYRPRELWTTGPALWQR
jgi:hypothetical protein